MKTIAIIIFTAIVLFIYLKTQGWLSASIKEANKEVERRLKLADELTKRVFR